jgi:hypothetical protein
MPIKFFSNKDSWSIGPSTILVNTKETPENKEGDPNVPAVEGDI